MALFNDASIYATKFKNKMEEDFAKRFPKIPFQSNGKIDIQFYNDPKAKTDAWADMVHVRGSCYLTYFYGYLGRINGNCGLATVTAVDVHKDYRRQGIGTWFMRWVTRMLSDMNFSMAVGTTIQNQEAIYPILRKLGWEEIPSLTFKNRRTTNEVKFWRLHIPEDYVMMKQWNEEEANLIAAGRFNSSIQVEPELVPFHASGDVLAPMAANFHFPYA